MYRCGLQFLVYTQPGTYDLDHYVTYVDRLTDDLDLF